MLVAGGPHRALRADVAGVLAHLLSDPRSSGRVLYVNSGEQPIEQALEEALSSAS
jgi:hypothetical protein